MKLIINKEKNQSFFSPSFFPKTRKGDVPVMMFVLGVIVVVVLAILSFSFSIPDVQQDFKAISFIERANSKIDLYDFYKDPKIGMSDSSIESILGLDNRHPGLYVDVSGTVNGKKVSVRYLLKN